MKSKFDVWKSKFAQDIYKQKYSMDQQENWSDTIERVVESVCGQLLPSESKEIIKDLMNRRIFIPGGRYLYSSGRPFHQVNNCFLFRAEDSREGWADLMQKITASLMTGGGIGIDYSAIRHEGAKIGRTGGECTGPLALMQMVNEAGRHIMQGGQRRSAIYASLHWKHADVFKFMDIKNWSEDIKKLKEKDFNFPAPLDMTNISVNYDTEFFVAIKDKKHEWHEHAKKVWDVNCRQAFSTAEPGMSFNFLKDYETLRNACVTGDTPILTNEGYQNIEELIDQKVKVWNGFEFSEVTPKITAQDQKIFEISFSNGRTLKCTPYHKFHLSRGYQGQQEIVEAKDLKIGEKLIKCDFPIIKFGREDNIRDMYTRGLHAADGNTGGKELRLYDEKIKLLKHLNAYSNGREFTNKIGSTKFINAKVRCELFGKNFVPLEYDLQERLAWFAGFLDGDGCELPEGGIQASSTNIKFLKDIQLMLQTCGVDSKIVQREKAGYRKMPDGHGGYKKFWCKEAKAICVSAYQMQNLKKLGLNTHRLKLEKSPNRDASRFVQVTGIKELEGTEEFVYCFNEPKNHTGIFNGIITGQCTEVTSEDDSDKCNLGTVWMSRCKDKEEFELACNYGTQFLMCGGIYSDVPTEKIKEVGNRNNRIGLGLGGMHEWLMQRGYKYEVTPEMHRWLNIYKRTSDEAAHLTAKELGVAIPIGKRALAPTGTIGIIAETTTGIEPLFCKAYKRRYLKGKTWKYQYVVDGAVKRLMEQGIPVENITDSYDISFKERVKFQADVQQYVDMAISSTCNLSEWGSPENNEESLDKNKKLLLRYAKRLRGFTCYPDGSRGGQPLTRVELSEALSQEGMEFEESEHECIGGVCGI